MHRNDRDVFGLQPPEPSRNGIAFKPLSFKCPQTSDILPSKNTLWGYIMGILRLYRDNSIGIL